MAFDNPGKLDLAVEQRNSRLAIVAAAYFDKKNVRFRAMPDIERTGIDRLRAMSTTGGILQPAVDALNAAGIATGDIVGDVMDNLGLTHDEVHDLACACHGDEMTGNYLGQHLLFLVEG